MTWFEEIDELVTGTHPPCQIGCTDHKHRSVPVNLAFSNRFVPDYPKLPNVAFRVECFIEPISGSAGYGPARCETTRSVRAQGIWEGFDTGLTVDLLSGDDDGIFLDFGSNIGWYSILARTLGRHVVAFEADPTFVEALEYGMVNNDFGSGWQVVHGWIDENTPALPVEDAPHIRLVKSDVEGTEVHVLRMLDPLFKAKKIDYMMLELSPMFANWEGTLGELAFLYPDYALFQVPDKGYDPEKFAADPLACAIATGEILAEKLVDQVTGLLVRRDLP